MLRGWVGGLLSLVDRQLCSWAKAHCDTGCCHFVQTCFALHFCNGHHFHLSLYMVLKHGTVSDPVVIAQASQMKGVSSNPALHSFSTCYGVVNLKLLCDPPPPPQGYPAGGWVGLRVGGWVSQNPGRANSPPPPPVSLSKGLVAMMGPTGVGCT